MDMKSSKIDYKVGFEEVDGFPYSCHGEKHFCSQIFSMSTIIEDSNNDMWCVDTDGLNFGAYNMQNWNVERSNGNYTSVSQFELNDLQISDNRLRHSYVNLKSNEGVIREENLDIMDIEGKNFIQREPVAFQSSATQTIDRKRNEFATRRRRPCMRLKLGLVIIGIMCFAIMLMVGLGSYLLFSTYNHYNITMISPENGSIQNGGNKTRNKISLEGTTKDMVPEKSTDADMPFGVTSHSFTFKITDANIPSIQEYTKAAGKSSSDNKEGDELLKRCKILTDMIGNEKTFDINLLTRLTDLGANVINNVDQYKEIIDGKMKLSRIYKLAEDIMVTQNILSNSPTKSKTVPKQRKEIVSLASKLEKELHQQVSSFCDEYSLFTAYVNVFNHLV